MPRALLPLLLGLFLLIGPARGEDAAPAGHAVLLGEQKVVEIRAGFKGFSAESRARNLSRRLAELVRESPLPPITVEETDISSDILAGEQVLASVFDADASAAGKPRAALAADMAAAFSAALARHQQEHGHEALLAAAAKAAGTLLAALALLALFERLYRRLRETVLRKADEKIADVERKSFSLVQGNYLRMPLAALLHGIRVGVWALLIYGALSLSLSYFPQTRLFAANLSSLVLTPLGGLGSSVLAAIPGLLVIAIIVLITRWLTRSSAFIFDRVADGRIQLEGFFPEWANPTRRIINLLLVVGAVMIAYPYIPGSDSAAFKGVSIFLGVLFSLGSSGVISNVVTGFMITYMRAFKVGDVVKIGDTTGVVVESSLLVTRLRTIRNIEITVPNSQILNGQVTNFSVTGNPTVSTQLTIGYDTPWRQVHAMLLGAAARTPGIVGEPPAFVLQTALEDFYIRYELMCVVETPGRMPHILSQLHQNILDTFNEHGVQIMSPHFIDNPDTPALVPKSQWHTAPAKPPEK
jgi:small-conductance mechanosensitive channel